MSRHIELMDAAGYWREVVTTFYFVDPGDSVAGAVMALIPMERRGDPPGVRIQTRDGDLWDVPAYQARLQFELKKAQPAVGDRIRITYTGQAKNSAPGLKPAKEFTVEVYRPGSRSQERPSGEAARDDVPGTDS